MPEPHDNRPKSHPDSSYTLHGGGSRTASRLHIGEIYDRFGVLHLALEGELDIATSGVVRRRLRSLRASATPAVLDLSAVSFIDCCGLRVIFEGIDSTEGFESHVQLAVDRSASVNRLLRVIHAADLADRLPELSFAIDFESVSEDSANGA